MEHLKSLEYSDCDCEQLQLLCDLRSVQQRSYRLSKLRNSSNLEQAAVSVLKHLGQVKRPYLTPLEEKLLGVLEQEYEAQ